MDGLLDGIKEFFSYIADELGLVYWMAILFFLCRCYLVMRRYGHSTGKAAPVFKQQNFWVILLNVFGTIATMTLLLRAIYALEIFGEIINKRIGMLDQFLQEKFHDFYPIFLWFYDLFSNILPFSIEKGAGESFFTLFFLVVYEFINNEILRAAIMEQLKKKFHFKRRAENSDAGVNEMDGRDYEFTDGLPATEGQHVKRKMIEVIFPKFFGNIYEYDPSLQRYFLRENYQWYRGLWLIVIVVLVILGVSGNLYCIKGKIRYNLVVFPLYIATQFWFACTLDTYKEFEEIRRLDPDDQYGMLVKMQRAVVALEEQFPDKIKGKNIRLFELVEYPRNVHWQGEEGNRDERLIDYYISACKRKGETVDEALVKPARILLKEKMGIIFATRFYQDIGYSFYFPMLRVLQSGGYCLVISGNPMDDESERELRNWILKGKQNMIGDSGIWRVGRVGRDDKKYEIGIVVAEDLANSELLHENNVFLSKVRIVLLIDAGALLYKQMFGIMNLRRMLVPQCSFAICNDNAEGLEDIYSHLLHVNIYIVFPTTEPAKQTICLFLDKEDITGKDLSHCLQIQAAEMFLRNGVEKVRWYGKNFVPIKDIAMRYGILKSADEMDSETEQSGKLVFGTREEICPREKYTCILVEDEICNPSEISHQFASRGKNGALLAVFSPPFFFLGFIRANLEQFYQSVRKIAQTFPAYYTSRRNVILQLLWVMQRQRVQDADVRNICRTLGQIQLEQELLPDGHFDKERYAEQITNFIDFSNAENAGKYILSDHNIGKDGEICEEFWIEKLPRGIYNRKNPCYYISIDPQEKHQLPQYCKEQLDQMYLQGQMITLDGNCYEVMEIVQETDEVEMFVRKSSQIICLNTRYRQKRVITLTDMEELLSEQHKMITVNLLNANIGVETRGYWITAMDGSGAYKALNTEQVERCRRSYKKKELLYVNVEGASTGNNNDNAQSCMLMLSELFHTVYAKYDAQLLVCAPSPVAQNEVQEAEKPLTVENFIVDEDWIMDCGNCFYIIEDSEEDLGLLDSILHNFDRFLEIFREYFEWKGIM